MTQLLRQVVYLIVQKHRHKEARLVDQSHKIAKWWWPWNQSDQSKKNMMLMLHIPQHHVVIQMQCAPACLSRSESNGGHTAELCLQVKAHRKRLYWPWLIKATPRLADPTSPLSRVRRGRERCCGFRFSLPKREDEPPDIDMRRSQQIGS